MAKNYDALADKVVELVGGKDNVSFFTHCVTRLRFVLKDKGLLKTEELKKVPGVLGVQIVSGQVQVIIGNDVDNVYETIINRTGLKAEEKIDENVDGDLTAKEESSKGIKAFFSKIVRTVSQIMAPILFPLAATGILKGILTIATQFGWLSAESGTYLILYAISDSVMYFFPIFIGYAAGKQFKIGAPLGMIIGASMVYPTLVNAVGQEGLTFLHIPISIANYTSNVFAPMVIVWLASLIYQPIKKRIPKVLGAYFTDLIICLLIIPVGILGVGPAVNFLGDIVSKALEAVYSFSPVLAGLLIGGPWIILVLLGMHMAVLPILMVELYSTGSSGLINFLSYNQMAMAFAMLAMAVRNRKDAEKKSLALSTGITCLLGVSEPGIFGVLLPEKWPFVMAVIASSLCTIPAGIFKTRMYLGRGGAPGIFGILGLGTIGPQGIDASYWGGRASLVLACLLGFFMVLLYPKNGFHSKNKKDVETAN